MTKFEINGKPVSVDVPDDTPLLWVIRDELRLTGTKFGCGIGLCGACTVHMDGDAARACMTPVSLAAGTSITTIEGLGGDQPHPLQQAWIETQAPQCGYCQSGQIMQAAAFLDRTPEPTDSDIDSVMTGNLCRCMAYTRIREAIKMAAANMQEGGDNE